MGCNIAQKRGGISVAFEIVHEAVEALVINWSIKSINLRVWGFEKESHRGINSLEAMIALRLWRNHISCMIIGYHDGTLVTR